VAYLIRYGAACQTPRCARAAEVELYGRHNESFGKFCSPCGKRRLKELITAEGKEIRAGL
jgi:hypothetical protein